MIKIKSQYWGLKEIKCDCCGKIFIVRNITEYVYRQDNKIFCSWHCLRKHQAKHKNIIRKNIIRSERIL